MIEYLHFPKGIKWSKCSIFDHGNVILIKSPSVKKSQTLYLYKITNNHAGVWPYILVMVTIHELYIETWKLICFHLQFSIIIEPLNRMVC